MVQNLYKQYIINIYRAWYFTFLFQFAEVEPPEEEEELEPEEELEDGEEEEPEEEGGLEELEEEEGGLEELEEEEGGEELEGGFEEEEPPVLVVGGARCGPKKGATADSFEYANAERAIHKRTASLIILLCKRLMFRFQETPPQLLYASGAYSEPRRSSLVRIR